MNVYLRKVDSYTVAQLQDAGILRVEDGNHGEYRPRPHEFVNDGCALYIRAADIHDDQIRFDTAKAISDSARRRVRKGIGAGGDILFSHKGTVGKLALAPPNAPEFVCSPQTTFWRTLDEDRLDRQFLYAYLRSPLFSHQWFTRKGETDMADYVSLTAQRRLTVPLPPIGWQRRVGLAVASLDELIENNCARIEILEEMARLLYREWFVHLRFPGHEVVELVDSDLGPIPRSWKARRLGEILELSYGRALRADDRRGGSTAVYGSGGQVGWHDVALVRGPGIVVGRKGNVGSVYWSDCDFFPIDTTYYVESALPLRFLDQLLRTLRFVDSHAAVPGLSRDQAYGLVVAKPDSDLMSLYDTAVDPMYSLRQVLSDQVAALREARDLLLPRLVSGELDVSELDLDLAAV